MLIPVEIASFAVAPSGGTPLLILKETSGDRALPIAIGPCEASAIAIKSLNVASERPLTADLARAIMEQLGGRLERVVIYDLVEQSFRARIHIMQGGRIHVIDCRPSDALALALRCSTPVFVDEAVFDKQRGETPHSERERLRENITNIDTIDFGRYHLE